MSLALVTGATGGLGLRIAERLASDGHDLLLVDVTDKVSEVAAGWSGTATAVVADLTDAAGVDACVTAVDAAGGSLDVLVNSAGITRDARIAKMEPAAFRAVIDINLLAAMRLTLALESRFADGAAVVNMSSRAHLGNFGQTNYAASKSGLVGFTRALSLQWAPKVRVNALAPSLVDTPMTQAMPPEVLEKLVATIPAGRIGSPDDIAGVVSFLASDQSDFVTGQVLLQCGGRTIAP